MPKYLCVASNMDGYVETTRIIEAVGETEAREEMAEYGEGDSIAIDVEGIKALFKKEKV